MPIIHYPAPSPTPTLIHEAGECVVSLGNQTLTGLDEFGVAWSIDPDQWQGWEGGPGSSASVDQRTFADGGVATLGFRQPRSISAGGLIHAPTHAMLKEAFRRLVRTVTLTDTPMRVVEADGIELTASVRRTGAVITQAETDTIGRWSINVVALDPLKYGITERAYEVGLPITTGGLTFPTLVPLTVDAVVSRSVMTVANLGTVDAWPVIDIAGPVTDPVVRDEDSTRTMRIGGTLQIGQVLRIDTARRKVTLQGQDRTAWWSGSWIRIAPGTTSIRYGAGTYDIASRLTLRLRDTYE